MATHTVRLEPEIEQALRDVQSASGLTVSAALKTGLLVLRDRLKKESASSPYAVYRTLDLALFDPRDDAHQGARSTLETIDEPLITTVPVLTEAFHLLGPRTKGAAALRQFVQRGGLGVWFLASGSLGRSFELMAQYADHPMDLADASLVAAAEALRTTRIFTVDRKDFSSYRARFGRRLRGFSLLSVGLA
jgi:predicted nucleic acid-binding protein